MRLEMELKMRRASSSIGDPSWAPLRPAFSRRSSLVNRAQQIMNERQHRSVDEKGRPNA